MGRELENFGGAVKPTAVTRVNDLKGVAAVAFSGLGVGSVMRQVVETFPKPIFKTRALAV